MLTDLIQIKIQGEKKRPENERFRRHLKSRDHSDRILRRIAEKIEEEIDCTACANCCRVADVRVSVRDVEKIAWAMRIAPERFLADFTVPSDDGPLLRRSESGCVFLNGNECSIYEVRPEICERFPHLVRGPGSIASRMWEMPDRACYCPIVFHSLEAFKDATGFRR